MNLPQCSQCLQPQELQELKEAYQLPVLQVTIIAYVITYLRNNLI